MRKREKNRMPGSSPVRVHSEIGKLEMVMVHTPGAEVENMTPQNAERALYSDILNLSVAGREYLQFRSILEAFTRVLEMRDLLTEVLSIPEARRSVVEAICENERVCSLEGYLLELPTERLCRELIEGVPLVKDNLSRFLSRERYALQPVHNAFFTRDPSIVLGEEVVVASLASQVREREAIMMQAIFDHHPDLKTPTLLSSRPVAGRQEVTLEGGDLLVAREDILLIGMGARTSAAGIDDLLEELKKRKRSLHLLVQELPREPESFIHLDMVFTLLDRDCCLIYEPVILSPHGFRTVYLSLEGGEVTGIEEKEDLLSCLASLGMPLKPIACGGSGDQWVQEREQWHSGANFLALAPGQILGYGRNQKTFEALDQEGFEIIRAREILEEGKLPEGSERFAVMIEGAELARGGGGCRCMSMPLLRSFVSW